MTTKHARWRFSGPHSIRASSAFALSAVDPPAPRDAPTGGGHVETCGGGSSYLNAYEKRALQLHNRERRSRGIPALCVHPKPTGAARAHPGIDEAYFSHGSYDGEGARARPRRFGCDRRRAHGEHVAWGSGSYGTPDSRFKSWIEQPRPQAQHPQRRFPRGRHRYRQWYLRGLQEPHHLHRRLRGPLTEAPTKSSAASPTLVGEGPLFRRRHDAHRGRPGNGSPSTNLFARSVREGRAAMPQVLQRGYGVPRGFRRRAATFLWPLCR